MSRESSLLFGVSLWEFTTTVMVTRSSPPPIPVVTTSVTAAVAAAAVAVLLSGATQHRPCMVASCSDDVTDDGRRRQCCPPLWQRIPLRDGSNCCSTCCMPRRPQRPLRYRRPSCRSWPPQLQLLLLQQRRRRPLWRLRCHCRHHYCLHPRHHNDCLDGVVMGVGGASVTGVSADDAGAVAEPPPLPQVCR